MVPNGWGKKSLEKVADVRSGVAKGKSGLKDPISVPYLRVANVQDGHVNLDEVKVIDIERDKLERYSLKKGDVLMNEGGDFDKLGRGDVWLGQIEPCLHQNHVFAVRPHQDKLDSYFLAALAASNYGKTYFLSCAKRSTNLASINSSQIKEFPVLLPPLPEQKKIAKILSTWDQAISTTEQLLANSQQQKKALMQQLLTGKKRLLDINSGLLFDCQFKSLPLKKICSMQAGKFISASDICNEQRDGTYPCFGGNGLRGYAETFTHDGNYSIIGRQGALCGNITFATGRFHATEHAVVVTPQSYIDTRWLYYALIDLNLNQYATGLAQPGLSVKNIEQVTINVPEDTDEQIKIASVLTAADQEIETLQRKLDCLKQEKKALMQQLLTGKRRVNIEQKELHN